jgi:anti-sigma factor ChrR (cupin superfamily)
VRLNADFSRRVVVTPDNYRWSPSPAAGVERMMLDRIGDEVARATSIVRYLPDSTFPAHVHGGGEELFVLDGEFADEHGSYPAGTYIRNPIGSRHSPRVGSAGATLFVKLHQFDPSDTRHAVVETTTGDWQPSKAGNVEVMPLHDFGSECVQLVRFAADVTYPQHVHEGGEEVFVIAGLIRDEQGEYPAGSWLRYPDGSAHEVSSGADGALLYLKAGHLGPVLKS